MWFIVRVGQGRSGVLNEAVSNDLDLDVAGLVATMNDLDLPLLGLVATMKVAKLSH